MVSFQAGSLSWLHGGIKKGSSTKNSCVLVEGKVVCIRNIFQTEGCCFIIISTYNKVLDLFEYPMASSTLDIYLVDDLSEVEQVVSISSIEKKRYLCHIKECT
jgi:predicted peptidase